MFIIALRVGTWLNARRYLRSGLYPAPKFPYILGLEGGGTVEALGEGVTEFKKGDRVCYAGDEVNLKSIHYNRSHMQSTRLRQPNLL